MTKTEPEREYFTWLKEQLDLGAVADEKRLGFTVEISLLPPAGTDGLLVTLGYVSTMVQTQCPVQAGGRKVFADFLIGSGDSKWLGSMMSPC